MSKLCEKCNKEYKVGLKDKFLRKQVKAMAKAAEALIPTLNVVIQESDNYCNECFKEEVQEHAATLVSESK